MFAKLIKVPLMFRVPWTRPKRKSDRVCVFIFIIIIKWGMEAYNSKAIVLACIFVQVRVPLGEQVVFTFSEDKQPKFVERTSAPKAPSLKSGRIPNKKPPSHPSWIKKNYFSCSAMPTGDWRNGQTITIVPRRNR